MIVCTWAVDPTHYLVFSKYNEGDDIVKNLQVCCAGEINLDRNDMFIKNGNVVNT